MKAHFRRTIMILTLVLGTCLTAATMQTTAQACSNHNWKITKVKNATYKKAGYQKMKCTICKKNKKVKLAKLTCTKHHFVVVKTKKATLKKSGYQQLKCKNCGKKQKVTLPKLTKQTSQPSPKTSQPSLQDNPQVLSASATGQETGYTSENVADMYGNGQDFTFTINGKTVVGHYDAKASLELISLLNSYRQSKGLPALATQRELTRAAMTRSREITVVFDHKRPDGSKWSTVSAKVSGENIAGGYPDAASIMKGWQSSPSHNANMLSSGFKTIGICVFSLKTSYGFYTSVAVQNFGR